ncbi:MAG: DUF4369 domain-containing protein [Bacteroidia bacterium]|nr:DUF4369 domain-containing protein [Bacteroidia bacterium]
MKAIHFSFFLLLITCMSLSSCQNVSTSNSTGYQIDVAVEGLKRKQVFLGHYYGAETRIIDTTEVKDGKFSFKGDSLLPAGMYLLVFPPTNSYLDVILDEDQQFSLKTDIRTPTESMQVSGSRENELYYQDLNKLDKLKKDLQSYSQKAAQYPRGSAQFDSITKLIKDVRNEVSEYKDNIQKEYPELFFAKLSKAIQNVEVPTEIYEANKDAGAKFVPAYIKAHFFDNTDLTDARLLRTPVLYRKVANYLGQYVDHDHADSVTTALNVILEKSNGNKEISNYLLDLFWNQYLRFNLPKSRKDSIFSFLSNYEDDNGIRRSPVLPPAEMIPPLKPGGQVTDFVVANAENSFSSVSQIKSEWTILYFWDYGCDHCQEATPKLVKAFEEKAYADKSVTLFTVNLTGTKDEWKEMLEKFDMHKAGIINGEDIERESGAFELYKIETLPSILILDKNKRLVDQRLGEQDLIKILDEKLALGKSK